MWKFALRFCVVACLAGLPWSEAAAAAAAPLFQVSSVSADDAGGIYNGSNVDITMTIKNAGSGAGSFQAALNIPQGYAFLDSKPCGGTVQPFPLCRDKSFPGTSFYLLWADGTDGMGSGNTLGVGASSTCTVRLTVNTATPNDVATVSVYNAPHFACNVTAVDMQRYLFATTSGPTTDMSIALGASKTAVFVGDTVDYTLTATNSGRQDSPNTNAVFNFPNTLSVVPSNCPGANTTGGQSISWNIGNVSYGSRATCVLTATVQSGAGTTATTTASVSVGATMTDPNAGNNTASNTVTLAAAPQADVSTTISANKTTVASGDAVTFTITAANNGPQDAASTQLNAAFPPELQLLSASCVAGNISSPLVWNIGALTAKTSQTCTVQAMVGSTSASALTSNASISSSTLDPNPNNNSSSVSLSVQQTVSVANLAVHLSGLTAGHTYAPGEKLHLTVTAQNTTPAATASGVVVTLHVPNSGDLSAMSATCGNFDATGTLTWTIATLIGGSSTDCNVTATVGGAARTIPVTVRIDATPLGSDLSQLMDSLLVPVNPMPRQISLTTNGVPTTKDSTHTVLSGNGSVAVFQSQDPHLVTGNANTNGQDIYRVGSDGKAVLESIDSAGHQLIGTASLPTVSADGTVVAFSFTTAKSLQAKAAITGQMWGGSSGAPKHQLDTGMGGAAPNGAASGAPSVGTTSSGGKKLVFCSAASNLTNGDANAAHDIFLVDPTNPALPTQLISTDVHGVQLPGDSCEPKISADGTKVVFTISAPTLYGTSARQVVRKDLDTGVVEVMSSSGAGVFANADSSEPTISGDGSTVAFTSGASNLDGLGAPVGGHEVFVSLSQSGSDGAPRILKRVRSGDGIVPNGASQSAQVSNDGGILVMQTLATNFFGAGKALGTPACGAVAMTMNFFSPAAMGSTLCNGSTTLQNPSISGDGTVVGFDSNAPQAGSASSNSNAYVQSIGSLNSIGQSAFADDFSGQWFDANQSGHGLVIDVLPPQPDNSRIMSVIWFVYLNGQPTWLLGAGVPHAGSGNDAGKVIVTMNQVGIYAGRSFPLGEITASAALWGSLSLTFTDANTASMSWTSSFPGFNSGTMALTKFLPVGTPPSDAAGAKVKACYSGNWKEPTKSGHGFEFEVIPASPPVLAVDWFAYTPSGAPVWLSGSGPISGNSATMTLAIIDGSGAQFPPKFNAKSISVHAWGTATFTFSDATHAHASWNSTVPGYGSGDIDLVPTFGLDRRGCQ